MRPRVSYILVSNTNQNVLGICEVVATRHDLGLGTGTDQPNPDFWPNPSVIRQHPSAHHPIRPNPDASADSCPNFCLPNDPTPISSCPAPRNRRDIKDFSISLFCHKLRPQTKLEYLLSTCTFNLFTSCSRFARQMENLGVICTGMLDERPSIQYPPPYISDGYQSVGFSSGSQPDSSMPVPT